MPNLSFVGPLVPLRYYHLLLRSTDVLVFSAAGLAPPPHFVQAPMIFFFDIIQIVLFFLITDLIISDRF